MMKKTIKYLKSKEWTMGNGQCHECCGNKPRHGWWTPTIGHRKGCKLAICLEELNVKVVWERKNHSKAVSRFRNDMKRACGNDY